MKKLAKDQDSKDNITYNYNGEQHTLIHPTTTEDIKKVATITRELQELIANAKGEDQRDFYEHLEEVQTNWNNKYVLENAGFDSSRLQKNISYLVKKNGLKMSELEDFLELSPGYISRTLNDNTNKRMSIDLAWKIAWLLNSDLNTMMTEDLQNQRGNTVLTLRFLDKLTDMTRNAEIEWQNMLGYVRPTYDSNDLLTLGVLKNENDHTYYMIEDSENGYPLDGDIMMLPKFINGNEDLYIIPFDAPYLTDTHYDFLTVKKTIGEDNKLSLQWHKLFDIIEALDDKLDKASEKLYITISDMYFDVKYIPDYKTFVENFLNS